MRYTFPQSDEARILFDLKFPAEFEYDVQWAYIRKVNDREIEGFSKQRTADGFSSLQNEYVLHFVVQFSKPFESFGTWDNDDVQNDTYEVHGKDDIGCFVDYKTEAGEVIQVKSGISLVSVEQARLNLETETNPFGWDFDAAREHARNTWNELLSTVKVEGGTLQDRIKFYTNFYRSYAAQNYLERRERQVRRYERADLSAKGPRRGRPRLRCVLEYVLESEPALDPGDAGGCQPVGGVAIGDL